MTTNTEEPTFLTPGDASSRLAGSLVRYEGNPFWIQDIVGGDRQDVFGTVYSKKYNSNKLRTDTIEVPYNFNPKLQTACFSDLLGLCNNFSQSPDSSKTLIGMSLSRIPTRHYKQGYSNQNSSLNLLGMDKYRNRYSISKYVYDVAKSYHNKYEDFDYFLKRLNQGTASSFAISRDIGFAQVKDKKGFLYQGDEVCGFVNFDKQVFSFTSILNEDERNIIRKELKDLGCRLNEK